MADYIWLTGPSGSGKSTIAKVLKKLALSTDRYGPCVILDTDLTRQLWPELSFNTEDINQNVIRTAKLAAMIGSQLECALVIICCISPLQFSRNWAINRLQQEPGRVLLAHIFTPLVERIRRDPKGLYEMVFNGEIEGLAGYDAPYDIPWDAKRFDGTKDLSFLAHSILEELK